MQNIEMLPDISLHVLDIVENSVSAKATSVYIKIVIDTGCDSLTLRIADNGIGMSSCQIDKVLNADLSQIDESASGIGLMLLRRAAEAASGSLELCSCPGEGTTVKAVFKLSDEKMKPVGDMSGVIHDLIIFHPDIDFLYVYEKDGYAFRLDSKELQNRRS